MRVVLHDVVEQAIDSEGKPHVSALQASLLTMIEPVLSAGIAWLAHGEAMHPMAMLGAACIVAAVLAGAWLARGGAPRSG